MQWTQVANVAMYDGANWGSMICKKSGMTPESAQEFAEASDAITFFFIATGRLVLSVNGVFNPGDAVFFSGMPWWGSTPALANGYVKPSPPSRLAETDAPIGNGWIYFESRMKVPLVTSPSGVIFAWPGLQPGAGTTFQPIGNGVLQPVLTFGQGPYPNPNNVSAPGQWWISGQYYGSSSIVPNGWDGGDVMVVNSGDELKCIIAYDAGTSTWTQTVTNMTAESNPSVSYSLALVTGNPPSAPQEQNRGLFCLENPNGGSLTQCVSLYDIVMKVAQPDSSLGQDIAAQPYVTGVSLATDNVTLNIERVVIYNPVLNASAGTVSRLLQSA
jgi:hypothetical protein